MKFNTILLFGAPGSGKGTQGKILGTIPNLFHCACGEVFRNLRVDSELGRVFIGYSGKGQLVPDEPTIELWRGHIDAMTQTGRFNAAADMLVLDGIPRNLKQAQILSDTLDVKAVFNLSCVDLDKLVHRLQRRALRENRLDDANLLLGAALMEDMEKETVDFVPNYDETRTEPKVPPQLRTKTWPDFSPNTSASGISLAIPLILLRRSSVIRW